MSVILAPTIDRRLSLRGVLWGVVSSTIYRVIPGPAYRCRRAILVAFGARLDPTARIRGGVRIFQPWNLTIGRKSSIGEGAIVWAHGPITIGARSVISQYCFVSSAKIDHEHPCRPQTAGGLTIGDDVWIATESVVLGGQHVPNGALVGARSVVDGPIDEWTIATGHPARSRRERDYQGAKS